MTPDDVAAACAAWTWVPETATTVETDELLLVRFPAWFAQPLSLLRLEPRRPLDEVVGEVMQRARAFDVDELLWWVRLGSPVDLERVVVGLGGVVDETLDVLALDLTGTPVDLDVPVELELRWNTDVVTERDSQHVQTTVFGDRMPPAEELESAARTAADTVPAGRGGCLVAYLHGRPVGAAGLAVGDHVARLWGGSVLEEARGRGVYRALLAGRLDYAREHGLTMGLVKGRVQTSAPILRRAGFTVFGQERSFVVPLRRDPEPGTAGCSRPA